MAFENSQAFVVESKKMVGKEQFENLCRLEVQAEKPIKKIIHVSANPKIVSSEKIGENINFSGRTAFNVVYETEEGALSSLNAVVEWQNSTTCLEDNYYICPSIQESVVSGFSANEVAVSSLVNIEVYAVKQEKITPLANLSDYVVKENTYEYQKLVNTAKEAFNEVVEQEYSGKLEEVLYYNGNVKLKSVTAGIDNICVEGEIEVSTYALENGRIVSLTKSAEFKQELGALSVVPNNAVDATIRLNDLRVSASVNETDNKTNLIISAEIDIYALVYSKETMTIVEDAFSINKETNVTYECVSVDSFGGQGSLLDTAVGSFETDKDIYEICFAVSSNSDISEVKEENSSVSITGATFVDFVCETETREKVKVQGVIPFLISSSEISSKDEFEVVSKVTSSKLRGQREIEVVVEINLLYKKGNTTFVTYLSQIEEVGDKKEASSAIKVYVVKENEDLFSVSKAMLVRPEVIVAQNATLCEDLHEGSRIVVYNGLDINF